jgi:acetylornithine/N-succinyldiaminopimelate aminotransferase
MTAVAEQQILLPTYARQDVTFVGGDGAWLVDDRGERYLDLVAGIAVVGLGHCHPAPLAAAGEQLGRLWHTSNLYWTEPMQALAGQLSDRFGGARAFFCNSGAEAIEAALKWARRAAGKPGIVALEASFHGRTLGALSVTGQPDKRAAFEPLLSDVSFARLNDPDSLAAAVGAETGAILLEPVQGEGGVHPASPEFLAAARELADANDAVLVFDEVQTGVGRTGSFFAFEQLDVRPDAVTLAKGLANGLPIGCLLVADSAPAGLEPGDHASTFGGNPVVCAAACAVCDEVTDELLAGVEAKGAALAAGLRGMPAVTEVRGRGLLLAADLDRPAADAVGACIERHLLVGSAGENTLRLTPPLNLSAKELVLALDVLREALA